jgi:hypothetical protein
MLTLVPFRTARCRESRTRAGRASPSCSSPEAGSRSGRHSRETGAEAASRSPRPLSPKWERPSTAPERLLRTNSDRVGQAGGSRPLPPSEAIAPRLASRDAWTSSTAIAVETPVPDDRIPCWSESQAVRFDAPSPSRMTEPGLRHVPPGRPRSTRPQSGRAVGGSACGTAPVELALGPRVTLWTGGADGAS